MRRTLLLATLPILACLSCSKVEPTPLAAGTEVPLILMTELASGGSRQGEEVVFLVTADVLGSDGKVAIRRGTLAFGRVAWSRSAGALSQFVNEPARLAVSVDRAEAIDGQVVYLRATETEDPFHFTRENTAVLKRTNAVDKALADPDTKAAIEKLLKGLEGENMGTPSAVADLAEALGMQETKRLADSRTLNDLEQALKGISAGDIARVAAGDTSLVVSAITEIAGLRQVVGDRIGGLFKGRNIRAFPGTPLTAYVAELVMVVPKQD